MPDKILIVEDEPALQETLTYHLKRQGYQVEVCADGHSAMAAARRFAPNLVVLDIMLPGIDGFEICRSLRQESSVPILILTARDEEIDRVLGLEMGADDYLTKPFSLRELEARLKALLRRVRLDKTIQDAAPGPQQEMARREVLTYGSLELDLTRREVRLDSRPLSLKPKEYELLLFLARHRGQVLSRDLILERVWGWDFSGGSRTVDVHVRWLREKIETDPALPTRIVTVRGAGYRFEG
jgi:DNA-binding response OmpR family regulator